MSNKVIGIKEFNKDLEKRINDIVEGSTYSQLSNYIEMLPRFYSPEKDLYYWGFSYINEYYKLMGKLDNINSEKAELLRHKIYILYLTEIFGHIIFSYEEFITFSKLLNAIFTDYNPNKSRDDKPYKSGNEEIDNIINFVKYRHYHSEHPHAYEIPKFKMDILRDTLIKKRSQIQKEELKSINLDELDDILSEERIKKLKEKMKY